jgi:hypothetical protein
MQVPNMVHLLAWGHHVPATGSHDYVSLVLEDILKGKRFTNHQLLCQLLVDGFRDLYLTYFGANHGDIRISQKGLSEFMLEGSLHFHVLRILLAAQHGRSITPQEVT